MRPIRAFLFARVDGMQWSCQVFRDFEPLLEAVIAANANQTNPVGIHVGFDRPETEAVGELLSRQSPLIFLSTGALGTMPSPVRASIVSIGSVGETEFHIALEGFGYQIDDPSTLTKAGSKEQEVATPNSSVTMDPRGWVAAMAKLHPSLFAKLAAFAIWDDDSYIQHENELDADTRFELGIRRFEILAQESPNANTIVDRLASCPPWLLAAPIDQLNLSVRSDNVCRGNAIRKIGDFAKFGLKGLFKLPNLGQKSCHEISREILHLLTTGRPLKSSGTTVEWEHPYYFKSTALSDTDEGSTEASASDSSESFSSNEYSSIGFVDGLKDVAANLTVNERGIWAARIGFGCEPLTLQQIADQTHLTRERVRQIEVKIYRKLQGHPFWIALSGRVIDHLRGRSFPLFLNGLPAIDPWFDGADDLSHILSEFSEHIPSLGFHILTWNESPVVSRISQTEWIEAIDQAKSLLMAIADQNLSESDALSQAAGPLTGKGEDMTEALQEECSKYCIWSTIADGTRILTGFGTSISSLVAGLLRASDTPLHIDEIQRRVQSHSTYEDTSVPNIRRAASEVGLLFGRGTYGLMKHCQLNASQLLAIRAEAEDIISGGSPNKQWHSSELYDELVNRGFSYEDKLTKYTINIALTESQNLVYLRRMIWGVRGKWSESADSRLDVKQAIVSLLEEEGAPMTTAQIRSKLIEGRGLNIHFQIWASSPLVRLGPGLWGLDTRDVDLKQARETAFRLLRELSTRQEGMHVSEVAAFLSLRSEDEVAMLVSIANKDGLRMDRGQYCYLQPWGESRRISVWDAATSILKAHPTGLPRGELQLYVDRIAKRKVDRQQLSGILQNIDAVYDSNSGLWKSVASPFEDGEYEATATGQPLEA